MSTPVLEASGLVRHFRSGSDLVAALDGVDLRVATGEHLAVVGPSGCGKSTLLACLAGLERPDAGRVCIEGQDLFRLDEAALAALRLRRVGFVFQSYRLLPALSAEENVRVPLELAGRADAAATAREWLDRVGLAARARHRPQQLSGGEQQRVALARALCHAPALVLADEPTGNLDAATGTRMAELIFALAAEQGTTLVYVTHNTELAARADRIVHLRDGRVEEEAGPGAAPGPG